MIYTVTFNPALDYIMHTDDVAMGVTNRSVSEEIQFGGKGINVSVILNNLGADTTALGFVAGFTGDKLCEELSKSGIKTDFVRLESGFTRINVKIKGKTETEINAKGPDISFEVTEKLFEKLRNVKSGDTVVLAGSIPSSLPDDIYEKILKTLDGKNIRFAVDATGKLLLNVLKYKPFVIKPNNFELEEIVGHKLNSEEDLISAARKLQNMGAVNVLVSRGKDGALLLDEFGKIHKVYAHNITPVNTVGAGDSMLAGFLCGAEKGYDYALKLANAAGGATAASMSLASKNEILSLLKTKDCTNS